ncbi:hypothetical protein M501DRAFT_934397, partial [Patellaria atrata CBS 101060]
MAFKATASYILSPSSDLYPTSRIFERNSHPRLSPLCSRYCVDLCQHGFTYYITSERVGVPGSLHFKTSSLILVALSSKDLWHLAKAELHDEDKRSIDFDRHDKLKVLAELHAEVEKAKQKSIDTRWKYTRKSGETVIIRDVFAKIIRWIDIFKQIGDVAIQYDPGHAALPWAGIRFVLQIAVNDFKKFEAVIEGLALVAELVCQYVPIEEFYLQIDSQATGELERAIVKLYAAILTYLSETKHYLEEGTAKRFLKSGIINQDSLEPHLNAIEEENQKARRCMDVVARHASKRIDILRWLSTEPYEQHHVQTKEGLLSGTGQWLLSDPVFEKWKNESASSILWLRGVLGTGKSKLVSIVIEDAKRSFEAGYSPQPVFFYCSRNPGEPTRSDPKEILASLARQLSCFEPGKALLKPTVELYEKKAANAFASGSVELSESCTLIMKLIEQYPQTTIVIDALDECDPRKRRHLLKAFEQILRDSSGLVKIFMSSRNDHDIVSRLERYPNLEIESNRNSDDIARFVKNEIETLIDDGELLHGSTCPAEMQELIEERVVRGASGMQVFSLFYTFRWASMQLQYLCSFTIDADIRKRLGRLPPDLDDLYAEIYDILSKKTGEIEAAVFRNVLSWLLCAERTLSSAELVAAVSIITNNGDSPVTISKKSILKICSNFVVLDAQLDRFRFAHLSVQEFLEKRDGFSVTATNALAAEACLWNLISASPKPGPKFLSKFGRNRTIEPSKSKVFREYSDLYWAKHCQLAACERSLGTLESVFRYFLSDEDGPDCPLALWNARISRYPLVEYFPIDTEMRSRLQDVKTTLHSASIVAWLVACAFNFPEIIEYSGEMHVPPLYCTNKKGRTLLHVAVGCESLESLKLLLDQDRDDVKITEEVLEVAASYYYNKEVMALLLDKSGDEVKITEKVLEEAAENKDKEVIALLLNRGGDKVKITEDVLQRAAENTNEEVIALLLNRGGDKVKITEEVLQKAAGNTNKEVLVLLLDQCGNEVKITEKVLKSAAWNSNVEVMELLLDKCGNQIKITEKVLSRAAWNEGVMALLLDKRGDQVKITEEVLSRAALNKDVMALLLDKRGDEVKITEEVLIQAVRSYRKDVIVLLLDKRGDEVKITKEVIIEAIRIHSNDVIVLLLDKRGNEVKISEEIVLKAARSYSADLMALLLNKRGDEVKITENVVQAATHNKEIMMLLLDKRGDEVKLVFTEEVLKAAASREEDSEEVIR